MITGETLVKATQEMLNGLKMLRISDFNLDVFFFV